VVVVPGRGAFVTGTGGRGAASRTGRCVPMRASAAQSTPDRSGSAGVAGALRAIVSAVPVRAGAGADAGAGVATGRAGVAVPGRGIFATVAGTAGRGIASRTGRTVGAGTPGPVSYTHLTLPTSP
jgi:hypothetical protein